MKMKKMICSLILIFIIFILSFQHSSAVDCPQGFDDAYVSFTYGNCNITIHYCHGRGPDGIWMVQIVDIIIAWDLNCFNELSINAAFMNICMEQVRIHFQNNGGPFPPCPVYSYTTIFKYAKCWAVKNVPPILGQGGYMKLVDCGYDGGCLYRYKLCTDFSNPLEPENKMELVDYIEIPSSTCTGEMPEMPPPGETWFTEWTTICYGITCYIDIE